MATIDDEELIDCVRQFTCIYDKNHGDYRNRDAKRNAWITVGRMVGVSEELCEQRWSVLRNRFATELRNRKKNPDCIMTPSSWRLYRALQFLIDYISPRKSRGTLGFDKGKRLLKPQDIKVEKKSLPPDQHVSGELRSNSPISTTRLRPIAPRPSVPIVTTAPRLSIPTAPRLSIPTAPRLSVPTAPRLSVPTAPRPSVPTTATVARFVSIPVPANTNETPTVVTSAIHPSSLNCLNRQVEYKDKHREVDDEDMLFGKSIGHSLRNVRNKKIKLQIKSEILSIIAQHSD